MYCQILNWFDYWPLFLLFVGVIFLYQWLNRQHYSWLEKDWVAFAAFFGLPVLVIGAMYLLTLPC
jgi:hypothetical protein